MSFARTVKRNTEKAMSSEEQERAKQKEVMDSSIEEMHRNRFKGGFDKKMDDFKSRLLVNLERGPIDIWVTGYLLNREVQMEKSPKRTYVFEASYFIRYIETVEARAEELKTESEERYEEEMKWVNTFKEHLKTLPDKKFEGGINVYRNADDPAVAAEPTETAETAETT